MIVISKEFWAINEEEINEEAIPPVFINTFDTFQKSYDVQKVNRKLIMLPNQGFVKIKLTFENGPFFFNSTPLQTHLISIFDEDKTSK